VTAGVFIGMVYAYILFMLFPLYNAIESLDRKPDRGGGAISARRPGRTHWRVVIPHAKPGIAVGAHQRLHAGGEQLRRAVDPRRPEQPLVHRDHLRLVLRRPELGSRFPPTPSSSLVLCIVFIMGMMQVFKVKMGDIAKMDRGGAANLVMKIYLAIFFIYLYVAARRHGRGKRSTPAASRP